MRRNALITIKNRAQKGFALPSVLIASVVMLTVLTVAVSATTAIRTELITQYYTQLSQAAAEAGIAQAVACLQANSNTPTWSNTSPLTPQTNCSGTVVSGYPTFLVNANGIQSSYSVGLPSTDSSGSAVTLSATGTVQLLRTSTGAVWRTYSATVTRPSTALAQCSSGATSANGWSSPTVTSYTSATTLSNAQSISPSPGGNVSPGPIYYRDAFYVNTAGTYTVTMAVDDNGTAYIDGSQVVTSGTAGAGATETGSVTLSQGCHTISVNTLNDGIAANPSYLALTVTSPTLSEPIEATNTTSWQVSVGPADQYSSIGYWMDGSAWVPVSNFGQWTSSGVGPWGTSSSFKNWASSGGEGFANIITSPSGMSGSNSPGSSYTYLRNPTGFYLSSSTSVKVVIACDDSCNLYVDGNPNPILSTVDANSQVPATTTVTLGAGWHTFGASLHNAGSSANPSGMLFDAFNGSKLLMRSDSSWEAANSWTSSLTQYYSYDSIYTPTPSQTKGVAYGQLLVIGGGGGGSFNAAGGGGGGAVVYYGNDPNYSGAAYHSGYLFSVGTSTVTVGAGGAGTMTSGVGGHAGGSSSFGSITAVGGGGGAPRDANIAAGSGGSGGGGAGAYNGWTNNGGGSGVSGQGNKGGSGTASDASTNAVGGGGGGYGGPGATGIAGGSAGDGGSGFISYMTAAPIIYAAGGGGSITVNGTPGSADASGGAGSNPTGITNSGGGGAAGGDGKTPSAGNGGSGLVIVSFPTGSLTASATGAYTVETTTSAFGGATTLYVFLGNGTFTVSSINI